MVQHHRFNRFLGCAGIALVAAACGGTPDGPAPRLEVNNDTDDFVFIAQSFDRLVTDTKRYIWNHTTPVAQVNEHSSIQQGQVSLVIRDANGTQLYSSETTGMGSFVTDAGTIQDWTIDVTMSHVRGDIFFTITKPDST
jgi:hypothetical protein